MKILKHFLVVFLVEALLLGALFLWMPKQKNSNILASESKGENTIVLTKSNEETVTITAKNKETTKERDFTIFDEKKLSADIEWKNAQSAQVKIIGTEGAREKSKRRSYEKDRKNVSTNDCIGKRHYKG